jgi:hypothetical protein
MAINWGDADYGGWDSGWAGLFGGLSLTRGGADLSRNRFSAAFLKLRGMFSGFAGDEYPGVLRRWGDTQ